MKTRKINIGDRVKINTGRLFKGSEANVITLAEIDGIKKYQVESDLGLNGWFRYSDLRKVVLTVLTLTCICLQGMAQTDSTILRRQDSLNKAYLKALRRDTTKQQPHEHERT